MSILSKRSCSNLNSAILPNERVFRPIKQYESDHENEQVADYLDDDDDETGELDELFIKINNLSTFGSGDENPNSNSNSCRSTPLDSEIWILPKKSITENSSNIFEDALVVDKQDADGTILLYLSI